MKRNRFGRKSLSRGESIVEVVASAIIFLMLMALFQSAVMFCTSAQKKSEQIRQDTAEICKKLQTSPATVTDSGKKYEFYAISADGSDVGNKVFEVQANLEQKEVSYQDADGTSQKVIFYLYGKTGQKNETGEPGGDSP